MRTIIAVVCVVIGILAGYSLRPAPAQAQSLDWIPFTAGETVRLRVDMPPTVIACKVSQVHNGFLGCAAREQQPHRWINLRFIQEITPHRER